MQLDLAEFIPLARYNRGYAYLLVAIDVLSKFARCIPLKSKSGEEMAEALEKLFGDGVQPQHVSSDRGKEFTGAESMAVFKRHDINAYTMLNPETGN